jgi:hypothetical protein
MPANGSSRNLTRETKRRREESPVVAAAAAPLEENPPRKKPTRPRRSWDESFQALLEYKEQHGDCNVPARYRVDAALGKWVCSQRSSRYSKKMTPEQKDRLKQLEFDWETLEEKNEHSWNGFFERLKAYRKKYGGCCVPKSFKEDPTLSKWVSNQRTLDKRGKLPSHRKEKLESIRFTWSIYALQSNRDTSNEDEKWFTKYESLLEFRQKQGHCIIPHSYEKDKSLGQWVRTQRAVNKEGRMKPDRFQLLEDIDFV